MNFVKSSLKYPHVTISVLALAFVIGVYSLLHMPRREDPKITIRQGLVIAYYPGATSLQVEDQVTKKLEQYLFQYEEVRKSKTYSTTRDGVVVINVELQENVKQPDIFWSKLKHELLIAKQLDLPKQVVGPIVNTEFGDTKALLIGIESEENDYAQLKTLTSKLEDELRTVQAVSKIKRVGEREEQITITSSSEKLAQYGIPLEQVVKVLKSQNDINPTGNLKTGELQVPLYTDGYYTTEQEIGRQVIGTSAQGDIIRLNDVAEIKREYEEPSSKIATNGKPAMLLALEMYEGNNIVELGENVQQKLDDFRNELPTGYTLTTIINQPEIVDHNISHFFNEFFLAIVSVVIVVILLMPFRIAAVAATAIPMTVAVTFALLEMFGIELHQVSLAALIVVLGMVVDDAIVVADNYVELLDKGVDRWNAAWRSAYGLIVPVFTATITIIAAFLPMVILSGSVGEFIFALPITVSIALGASFFVSMVLTPLLCFAFIKKGLHKAENEETHKKKPSVLDRMQNAYNKSLDIALKYPKTTVFASIISIVAAGFLYLTIDQKFFPAAERNQFVLELWMPTGTQLEATEKTAHILEDLIDEDDRVVNYTTFTGTSAPRFYYNFSPEFPVSNYAQILVNTTTDATALELAEEINHKVDSLIPQGIAEAKLMQQGTPTKSPVEIRIVGSDLTTLEEISDTILSIVKHTPGSRLVQTDFKEDMYGVAINLKDDAGRLGFTTGSVGQTIYTGFSGAPVSTMYEGSDPLNLVFRLENEERQTFDDLNNTYLASAATGAPVPLRAIANLEPKWNVGRIMHRNGLRTLTVGSETAEGVLPSQLLKKIRPQLKKLELPHGYHLEIGGEHENKKETFSQMITALAISLVLIFFILLIQFKNLKEATIIMYSIPLSLFGALAGLHLTGNNFGFTAFVGLISLSGIVVRNAIILVDYANELMREGMDLKTAAIEAGKRRLRPIFLTASAAAIGVIPMIASGSPMWSPLASVIAVGVLFSMVMSLIVIPVIYVGWMKPKDKKYVLKNPGIATGLVILFSLGITSVQAQTSNINLQMVTDSTLHHNHLLAIRDLQEQEMQAKVSESKVKYFPKVTAMAGYTYLKNLPTLTIPQGALGTIPTSAANLYLPEANTTYTLGNNNMLNAGVLAYQPISQLFLINSSVKVSTIEREIATEEKKRAITQLKEGVEKVYFGLLITQKQKEAAEIKIQLAQQKLKQAEDALSAGKIIDINTAGLMASLAENEQELLKLENQFDAYKNDLSNLSGIALNDNIRLEDVEVNPELLGEMNSFTSQLEKNPDIQLARLTAQKASLGVQASKRSFIPDLGIVGGYAYQTGMDLLPENNPFVGLSLSWDVQGVFTDSYKLQQRKLQQQQSVEKLKDTEEKMANEIEQAYKETHQAIRLIEVAEKVVHYRKEAFKLEEDRKRAGLNTDTDWFQAKADLTKAEADLYGAYLGYRNALLHLKTLIGTL